MPELPDDVLQIIFDLLPDVIKQDYTQDSRGRKKIKYNDVARACCLVNRRFLPFGRQMLYRRIFTSSASSHEVYDEWLEWDLRPGPAVKRFLEKPQLATFVEEWAHVERDYPGTEGAALQIEDLERVCPNLRSLKLGSCKWKEDPTSSTSSHLSRQLRALCKTSGRLLPRLKELHLVLTPLPPQVAVPLGLNTLLRRAGSLTSLTIVGAQLLSAGPPSLLGPPSLRALSVGDGHLLSLLPLIEHSPSLTELNIYINHTIDAYLEDQGVRRLSNPHLGLEKLTYKHRVHDMFSDAPFKWYDDYFIDQVDAFIASFPNLLQLDFGAGGFGRNIDLDNLPRRLERLTILENGGLMDPAAGPTLKALKKWVEKGGGPMLKVLCLREQLSGRAEEMEGVRKACGDRKIELRLTSRFDSLEG